MKKVYLIGEENSTYRYKWISDLIETVSPDCITLEQCLDTAFTAERLLTANLEESISNYKNYEYFGFADAAAIHYGRLNDLPIYCIDEYRPFSIAKNIDISTSKHFKLHESVSKTKDNFTLKRKTFPLSLFKNKTPDFKDDEEGHIKSKIKYMANGINHLLKEYDTIVHIVSKSYLDSDRFTVIQEMIDTNYIEICNSVTKERTVYK